MGRMLLSHNFNLLNNELSALSRVEFSQVFIDGLKEQEQINCNHIENPHWVTEIIFSKDKYEPKAIGQMCGEILQNKRKDEIANAPLTTDTLILGGKKTTPVANNLPTTLQPGEWGVDVVETASAKAFLASINWEILTADKPSDGIFEIEFSKEQ